MSITYKGKPITREKIFYPCDTNGIGRLVDFLVGGFVFGGPPHLKVTVHPKRNEVTLFTSCGSSVIKEGYINTTPILTDMGLYYQN